MNRHLVYIGSTLPTPGFGSSVVIYRHLKRLSAEWKVSLLAFDSEREKHNDIPDNWEIITIPQKKWFYPPVKRRLPFSLDIRLHLLSSKYIKKAKKEKPDAILAQLGKNSLFAKYVSQKLNIPLSVIVHDRWQAWSKYGGADKLMTEELALSVLDHASRVWPVSQEMGDFYKVKDSKKVRVLYPIPEGNRGGFSEWKDEFKINPVIGMAGSFHSPQLDCLKKTADILQKYNGKLLVMTKKNELIRGSLSECSNIGYKEPLPHNSQAIDFLKSNVSGMIISGSIDTKAVGWDLSFPSRWLEFSHLGVPIIIVSPWGTALSRKAKELKWTGYLEEMETALLEEKIKMLLDKENWEKMADESRCVAMGEFNPSLIQKQFEEELVLG